MQAHLGAVLHRAATTALGDAPSGLPGFERTRDPKFGDYSTNWAMHLARPLGRPALGLAEAIAAACPPDAAVAHLEAAAPGFLNVRLADAWLLDQLHELLSQRDVDMSGGAHLKPAPGFADTWTEPVDAREETYANPAYLIRHTAHWLGSLGRLAVEEGLGESGAWRRDELDALDPADGLTRASVLAILAYPDELARATETDGPERLMRYATAIARTFHRFYARHRVFGQPPAIGRARLAIIRGNFLVLWRVMVEMGVDCTP